MLCAHYCASCLMCRASLDQTGELQRRNGASLMTAKELQKINGNGGGPNPTDRALTPIHEGPVAKRPVTRQSLGALPSAMNTTTKAFGIPQFKYVIIAL